MGEEEQIKHNRRLAAGILLAVVGGILAAVLFRTRDSGFRWDLFLSTLAGSNLPLLALSLIFVLLTYIGRAFRWRVMLQPLRPNSPIYPLISATLIGFTAVVFFGRPGEFVRPWLIARREQLPLSSQLAAWFLERVLDLLMVLLLFGFALTQIRQGVSAAGPRLQAVLASGGAVALALGVACIVLLAVSAWSGGLARRWFPALIGWLPRKIATALQRTFEAFLDGLAVTGSASSLGKLLGWTVLEWTLILAGIHFALLAYPPTSAFTPIDSAVFAGFIAFGSAVQLPGIGGGLQVAAVLVLTEVFGLSLEIAAAVAILVWALSWLTVVPFGLVAAFSEGLQWSSLKKVDESLKTGATP